MTSFRPEAYVVHREFDQRPRNCDGLDFDLTDEIRDLAALTASAIERNRKEQNKRDAEARNKARAAAAARALEEFGHD